MTGWSVGIVGLGVGEAHLRTYQSLPNCEVKAICDIDPIRLNDIGNRYDVSDRYTDYRKLIERSDIDIVSICSYDDAHAAQCISAFENGKHVFVEKPVALSRADAAAVLRAQQDSGRKISSNLILRREERFIELRRQIADGDLGEIFSIEADYLHQILWKIVEGWRGKMDFYCVVYGGGIHLIDLMRWLLDREIEEVASMGNKILTRGTGYEFDDTIVSLLRFEGGALGKTMTTFGPQRSKFHSLNVYGTRATFVNDLPDGKFFVGDQSEQMRTVGTAYPSANKGDLIPDFVDAISEGREPNVSARDVFRVMDVCFAAWDAIKSRRTVQVEYLL